MDDCAFEAEFETTDDVLSDCSDSGGEVTDDEGVGASLSEPVAAVADDSEIEEVAIPLTSPVSPPADSSTSTLLTPSGILLFDGW